MIVPLADADDAARFGGKAAALARAVRAGLPVPCGVAIAADDVERLASDDARRADLAGALARSLDGPLAIRSSALDEDSAHASFAGQHRTELNVRGPAAIATAIHTVWSSARTEGALAYRARLGVGRAAKMAVVAQRLVYAEIAGVLFTKHPTSGADERVIEAARGLGEAVVQGLVTPDTFRVARGGALLAGRAGDQDVAVFARDEGGTEERPVAPAHGPVLDRGWLVALDALASRCEASFGEAALDLEWAIAAGQLHLLQCRRMTR